MTDAVGRAVDALRRGLLVAFPTETVYGLGADAADHDAVARIFAAKGRPLGHPLIVHLGDATGLDDWAATVPDAARTLAAAFWPGPLTLVVPRALHVADVVTGGRETVALRVPAQPLALELLARFGGGIAAPSANRFGRVSPTTADDVRADLGDAVAVILDGGPCAVGLESTIVDVTVDPPMILRPGGATADEIEGVLGHSVTRHATGPARAPGMLEAHYAPRARVLLVDNPSAAIATASEHNDAGARVAVLAPDPVTGLPATVTALTPAGAPADYARVLYARLREADRLGVDVLVVVPPSDAGIGVAVRDRLKRAAAGSAELTP